MRDWLKWTPAAHYEHWRDVVAGAGEDPGPEVMIKAGLQWLSAAQDHSATADGGVARHYSLLNGWGPSYPETTGYITATFLQQAKLRNDPTLRERARRMLDWQVSIQLPSGAAQGSTRHATTIVPVVFDTGKVLIGFAVGAQEFGEPYLTAMRRAADWLISVQDQDGAWRVPNPFVDYQENIWDAHCALGLLEASRLMPDRGYTEAALQSIRWAIRHQQPNGWFDKCCLSDVTKPLTHTIGYTLRPIVEGYRVSRDPAMLEAAMKTARAVCRIVGVNGHLAGRLDKDWLPASRWDCLTGSSQISICLLLLHKETGDKELLTTALALNRFVRSTVHLTGAPGVMGGIKGSFPVSGAYSRFQFLSWATKFTIDAATLEMELTKAQ